jgi:hypothetical protein
MLRQILKNNKLKGEFYMLKSFGMLSLCMALVFVFSTVSFAKTKALVSKQTSRTSLKSSKTSIKKNCNLGILACADALADVAASTAVVLYSCVRYGPSSSQCDTARDLLSADVAVARAECSMSQNQAYWKKPELKLNGLAQFARSKDTFRIA